MTFKNIPLLYLSFVVLSVTNCVHSFPVPEDGISKPTFEPPREVLLLAANDNAAPPSPNTEPPSNAAVSATPEPTPAQVIAEKLAHTGPATSSDNSAASPPQPSQEVHENLEVVPPPANKASPASTEANNATSDTPDDHDDIVVNPADPSISVPAPLPHFEPTSLTPPPAEPTDAQAKPTEAPNSDIAELPTTVLTVTPTFRPAASTAAQFYSISTNPYATFTSHASASSAKPSVPLPSQGPAGESEITKQSRRTAVVGSLVAVGLVMSLVAFVFCFRCQCFRRKKRSSKPLDLLAEDHERESLSVGDKEKMSPISSPNLGFAVPILRSQTPHSPTYMDSPEQQEWRVVAATQDGQVEDLSHVITDESFMDIDLSSHPNLYVAGIVTEDITQATASRASAGAASTGGQSYSTRASTYSSPSIEQAGQLGRASASFDKLNQLASLATTPSASGSRSRKRSKTETSATPPQIGGMKPTKSLPSITSYENRFSNDSTRSRKTTCSGDSEWDVAQAYGAPRYSKESGAGGSILSTISEATMESVEAVEVGGKQCVLMKGKF